MKIVQDVKDTGVSGQVVSRRDEHPFLVVPTDSIFIGETKSKILIPRKMQQERMQRTQPQQCVVIQG